MALTINDQTLLSEYIAKRELARHARNESNYALTQAYERQALDRLNAMTSAGRAYAISWNRKQFELHTPCRSLGK